MRATGQRCEHGHVERWVPLCEQLEADAECAVGPRRAAVAREEL